MTQCDPGGLLVYVFKTIKNLFFSLGSLPAWIVNRSSKVLVPKVRFCCFLSDN